MIDNLLDEIARAQMAKKQYTQAGRQDLAQGAQNWGTQQAQKLAGQGIQLSPDADLTSRFTQKYGDQFAGTYDPMKQGQVLRDNPNLKPKQMDYYNELERVRIDPATGKKYVPTSSGIKHVMDLLNKQKQYNDNMALGFSERYGVPIKPMEKLEDLFSQVKGMKPLNIEERDYRRSWDQEERTYNREQDTKSWDYKYDERDYQREQDDMNYLRDEAAGLREAVLSGNLSTDQALAQIQDDLQSGLYTPEQARILQGIAGGMKTYGDKQKREQIDLTLSSITPQTHSAEEAKAAIVGLGILSPAEQMQMNQEIDAKWKADHSADPGVMDKIKGALSGGTWQNTVGGAVLGAMTLKALLDSMFKGATNPKEQP